MATVTMTTTDISSASAVAMAAASSRKQRPSALNTPQSATFDSTHHDTPLPSALLAPSSAGMLSAAKSLRTPLTPPSQYLDFLKLVDKAKSPLSTSTSVNFNFSSSDLRSPYPWPKQPASARPALVSAESNDSNVSRASEATTTSTISATSIASEPPRSHARRASDGVSADPPGQPRSASTSQLPSRPHPAMRRPSLMIPESPSTRSPSLISPESTNSSAKRGISPASATAAKNYYLGLSPATEGDRSASSAGGTRPFHVRQVITRTYTYKRPAGTVHPTGSLPRSTGYSARPSTSTATPSMSPPGSAGSNETTKSKMSLGYVLGSDETEEESRKHKNLPQYHDAGQAKPEDAEKNDDVRQAQSVQPPLEESWGQPPQKPLIGDAPKGKRRKIE